MPIYIGVRTFPLLRNRDNITPIFLGQKLTVIRYPPNTLQIFSECFTLLDDFKLLSKTAPWLRLLCCCTFDSLPPTTSGLKGGALPHTYQIQPKSTK